MAVHTRHGEQRLLAGIPLLHPQVLRDHHGSNIQHIVVPVKHPPDQSLETMEVFRRGMVIGFNQGNVDRALEQWLDTEEGRDRKIPSVELRYQTHDS